MKARKYQKYKRNRNYPISRFGYGSSRVLDNIY